MSLTPGHAFPVHTQGPIERIQLVRYAGASGDFNPIHVDETFAKAAGYPTVFAQGMLTMGILGRALVGWAGDQGRIRSFSTRFSSIVWPGEVLTCKGRVSAVQGGVAKCDLQVLNSKGEVVAKGSAEIAMDTAP
ncbi:MAG: MaoC family dehydratase N-terminal domain-containing protein [Nitrospirae bacterium]|nr:MaoC family dehydratase N-terminal domain-containing protein [Nitrospirota bacterium]